MAKHIIQYKMHGKDIPWYIEEPGIFMLGNWYVGLSKDDEDCYIPSDVLKLTKQQLKTEFKKHKFKTKEVEHTDQEKEQYIEDVLKGKLK